jgi:hypothetical protein
VAQQVGKGGAQPEAPIAPEAAPEENIAPESTGAETPPAPTIPEEGESKKKFTKSYGA